MSFIVYLEAAARTQDLLTAKWTLRSCGYEIASTWHEAPVIASDTKQAHLTRNRLEELKRSHALVVIGAPEQELSFELAFAVGFAAARNIEVIWIGAAPKLPECLRRAQFFASVEEFRQRLLPPGQNSPAADRLAA